MHYLIDGHNLIASLPDIDLADPNDEVKLVLRLRSWTAAAPKRRVTVIFDAGLLGGRARDLSSGPVKVIFAPAGKTADSLLIARINNLKNPAEHTLVSSDQQIIRAAQARGLRCDRSEKFAHRLAPAQAAPPPTADTPDVAEEPQISAGEVAEFLELFGPVPDPPTPPKPARPPKAAKPKQPKPKTKTPLATPKHADQPLDEDDVEAWLEIFKRSKRK